MLIKIKNSIDEKDAESSYTYLIEFMRFALRNRVKIDRLDFYRPENVPWGLGDKITDECCKLMAQKQTPDVLYDLCEDWLEYYCGQN